MRLLQSIQKTTQEEWVDYFFIEWNKRLYSWGIRTHVIRTTHALTHEARTHALTHDARTHAHITVCATALMIHLHYRQLCFEEDHRQGWRHQFRTMGYSWTGTLQKPHSDVPPKCGHSLHCVRRHRSGIAILSLIKGLASNFECVCPTTISMRFC